MKKNFYPPPPDWLTSSERSEYVKAHQKMLSQQNNAPAPESISQIISGFFSRLSTYAKWLFIFEKKRYWPHGAYSLPPILTQDLWDQLVLKRREMERRKEENELTAFGVRRFFGADTTQGTTIENFWQEIGPRPIVPEWFVHLRMLIFLCIALVFSLLSTYIIRHT